MLLTNTTHPPAGASIQSLVGLTVKRFNIKFEIREGIKVITTNKYDLARMISSVAAIIYRHKQ